LANFHYEIDYTHNYSSSVLKSQAVLTGEKLTGENKSRECKQSWD